MQPEFYTKHIARVKSSQYIAQLVTCCSCSSCSSSHTSYQNQPKEKVFNCGAICWFNTIVQCQINDENCHLLLWPSTRTNNVNFANLRHPIVVCHYLENHYGWIGMIVFIEMFFQCHFRQNFASVVINSTYQNVTKLVHPTNISSLLPRSFK